MLSRKQFADAKDFLVQYQDALACIEQIAENRETYKHYQETAGHVVRGMQNN